MRILIVRITVALIQVMLLAIAFHLANKMVDSLVNEYRRRCRRCILIEFFPCLELRAPNANR